MQHQQYHLLKLVDTSAIPYHLPFNCTLYSQVSTSSLQTLCWLWSQASPWNLLFARCATSVPADKYGHVAHPCHNDSNLTKPFNWKFCKAVLWPSFRQKFKQRGVLHKTQSFSVWCERKSSMMSNDKDIYKASMVRALSHTWLLSYLAFASFGDVARKDAKDLKQRPPMLNCTYR